MLLLIFAAFQVLEWQDPIMDLSMTYLKLKHEIAISCYQF